MDILLAFAPFFAFAVVDRAVDPLTGMIAGALVAAALLARDALAGQRGIKLLEVGTLLLFGGLAAYFHSARPDWSVLDVRLRVDAGLFAIVLLSIVVRRPFTLSYARRKLPPSVWTQPGFLRANDVISGAWAAAFAAMVAADLLMLYRPDLPKVFGIAATVAALYGAMRFTAWYPERAKAQAA